MTQALLLQGTYSEGHEEIPEIKSSPLGDSLKSLSFSGGEISPSLARKIGSIPFKQLKIIELLDTQLSGEALVEMCRPIPGLTGLALQYNQFRTLDYHQITSSRAFPNVNIMYMTVHYTQTDWVQMMFQNPDAFPKLKHLRYACKDDVPDEVLTLFGDISRAKRIELLTE